MKTLMIGAIAVLAMTASAEAQTVPDLKGTWTGRWRTVIYGQNPHHPGQESVAGAPRVREITFTLEVEGQDGSLLWGKSWSNPERKEPFAAAVTADGKTIIGADTDGSLTATIAAPDRLEMCYAHNGSGPSKSIVASCGVVQRSR
jgi:hypothetical protein